MNEQPDKFFRDKLRNYDQPVSHNAWERIAAHRETPGGGFRWLKIAAALLLLAVAGVLLFPVIKNDKGEVTAENTPKETISPAPEKPLRNSSVSTPDSTSARVTPSSPTAEKTVAPLIAEKAPARKIEPEKKLPVAVEATPAPDELLTAESVAEALPKRSIEKPIDEPLALAANAAPKHVTIVFTAEEVNEKYLTKKTIAEATRGDEDTSTLKRLLDKAHDLTTNQSPIGDLRQKKNEILALNFKGEKQRIKN